MLKVRAKTILPILFLNLVSCTVTLAQASTATLSGTVTDQQNAVVAGATVTITNPSTGFVRTVQTDESGSFVFALLPPAVYRFLVERSGFTPYEVATVILNVGDQKALQIQLKVGQVGANVEVTPDASLVNDSPAVATTVDRTFVRNLPLNGRSFQSLIAVTPGVVVTPATGISQGQFSVNGQRTNSNYFTVDGVSANIGVPPNATESQAGGGSLPGYAITGGTNNLVSVDALQEFKIQTSTYAPEFGRTPGAQISIVTRSGTNSFSGSLFEYFRNEAFDANDWFNNARRLTKPATRQNQFGGVFSGPIFKERTFFFFSYEGLRLRLPQSRSTDVPSVASRQAAPAAVRPLLEAFPVPNGPPRTNPVTGALTGYAEFVASFSLPSTLDATGIRVDHAIGTKMNIFGRYNHSPSESSDRQLGRALSNISFAANLTRTLTLGATNTITSHLANELRFNYSHNSGDAAFKVDNFGGAKPLDDSILFPSSFSSENSLWNFTLFDIVGGDLSKGLSVGNLQRQINFVDSVSWTSGDHRIKFGTDYRRLAPVFNQTVYNQGVLFASINEALTGIPFQVSVTSSPDVREPVFHNFSLFGQDTWTIARRLSITYGMRWEINPPPTESNNNYPAVVTGLSDPAILTLAPFGTALYKTTYGNFAPRIGVSYQLSQRSGRETVVRGGVGVFYDLGTGTALGPFVAGRFPYTATKRLASVPLPLTTAQAAPILPSRNLPATSQVTAFDPGLQLPRTLQWNIGVEQSLGRNQTLSVTYLGAAGRKLLRQEGFINPNVNFPRVDVTRNAAKSDYNSLQFQFKRRLTRGFQTTASYSFSKSMDNASTDTVMLIPGSKIDPQIDRGPSDFDVRHSFSAALTYDIPIRTSNRLINAVFGNWAVDSIFFARSALPVNITYTRNITGIGSFPIFRPDLVPGVPIVINDPTAPGGKIINNAANPSNPRQVGPFAAPIDPRQGDFVRNSLRAFPATQIDMAVRRRFGLTEKLNLQLRAEMFNLLNHPNFGPPSGNLGSFSTSAAFPQGRITGTSTNFGRSTLMLGRSMGSGGTQGGFNPLYQIGGPRSVQLSARIEF